MNLKSIERMKKQYGIDFGSFNWSGSYSAIELFKALNSSSDSICGLVLTAISNKKLNIKKLSNKKLFIEVHEKNYDEAKYLSDMLKPLIGILVAVKIIRG